MEESWEFELPVPQLGHIVYINKVGGGTVGEAYVGDWDVLVTDIGGVELEHSTLTTGTMKTHRQAARLAHEIMFPNEL